ncbi:MAG: bifunctional DNA primase/polymerase [Planctomycetes bacterium]|nr:bifunctional DNA primase/polymerase [Planctomycetota bacterium]
MPSNGHSDGNGDLESAVIQAAPTTGILEAALTYVDLGFWVLALHGLDEGRCSCGRLDCPTPGKHLRNKCATRDLRVVRQWWKRWPATNVGLATGRENRLLVLDVDVPLGGTSLALTRRYGSLPPTAVVRTGSGGRHLYFRHPGPRIDSTDDWRPGIDVRSDRGYVVAPPSVHASGRVYRWTAGSMPLHVASLPKWLFELLISRRIGE